LRDGGRTGTADAEDVVTVVDSEWREGHMKARLALVAIGIAMAFLGCATRGALQIAQYSENGVITVSPDQVFEN
jgi:hypothetical protein